MMTQILAGIVVKHAVELRRTHDTDDDTEYVEKLTTSEKKY